MDKYTVNNIKSRLYRGLLYNNIGGALLALEYLDDAKKYFEEYLQIREENSASISEIAVTKNNLAEVFRCKRDMRKTEKLLNQALVSIETTYRNHPNHPNHPVLAMTLNNLGVLHLDLNQHKEAKNYFEKTLNITNYLSMRNANRDSVITLYNLAINCWRTFDYKDALNYFEKSLDEARGFLSEKDPVFQEVENKYKLFLNRKKFSVEKIMAIFLK